MTNYLVYQVGCIECGVSSYPSTWETEGGEGYVTVIDLHTCKTVA